jgi:uncharacterized membrane protein
MVGAIAPPGHSYRVVKTVCRLLLNEGKSGNVAFFHDPAESVGSAVARRPEGRELPVVDDRPFPCEDRPCSTYVVFPSVVNTCVAPSRKCKVAAVRASGMSFAFTGSPSATLKSSNRLDIVKVASPAVMRAAARVVLWQRAVGRTGQAGMVTMWDMSASSVSPNGARAPADVPGGDAPVTGGATSLGWMQVSALVLCVLGLLDSAYQTYTHFTGTGLAGCSAAGDPCVLVQNSSYAYVAGIPVAVLGVAFYAFMVAICSPAAWRSGLTAIRWVRLASVVTGMIFVLYLVYAELIGVGRICPYCTSVHIITFLLFTLIVCQFVFHPPQPVRQKTQADSRPLTDGLE